VYIIVVCQEYDRVPTCPGNVLEFYKIKKCRGKNIACENIQLEQKYPVNKYYACKIKLQL